MPAESVESTEFVSANIYIAAGVEPSPEQTEAVSSLVLSIYQDPRFAYSTLSHAAYILKADQPGHALENVKPLPLHEKKHEKQRELIERVVGMFALTGDGRDYEFDSATQQAIDTDHRQRQLMHNAAEAARNRRPHYPKLRKEAAIGHLLFFIERVMAQRAGRLTDARETVA